MVRHRRDATLLAQVKWQRERFDECVSKLKPFLKTCGYIIKKEVRFIPISGLTGANVLKEVDSKACSWWDSCSKEGHPISSEKTLLEMLDKLQIEGRDANAPLRIPLLDRYHDRGCMTMGKVEAGRIRKGDKVIIMPTKTETTVEGIFVNDTVPIASAKPGENVHIKLGNNVNIDDICRAGPPSDICRTVIRSDEWSRKFEDRLATKQRWYCPKCQAITFLNNFKWAKGVASQIERHRLKLRRQSQIKWRPTIPSQIKSNSSQIELKSNALQGLTLFFTK